jgi:hypothetical protein
MTRFCWYKDFPYRVNAISLMQFSSELKLLCWYRWKQVRVTEGNEVTAFWWSCYIEGLAQAQHPWLVPTKMISASRVGICVTLGMCLFIWKSGFDST